MRCLVGVSIVLLLGAAACSDGSDSSTTTQLDAVTTTTALAKPTVSLPGEAPTELVTNDLITGSGPAAEIGDNVLVYYVGVLTADGTEFDSNYGGDPIEFFLGAGRVIQGWDLGLIGAQQGTRRQLDIPPDLAYGDSPPSGGAGPIKAGAALSFVVDVVVVIPTSDKSEEPQINVSPAGNIEVLQSTDLIVGEGPTPQDGQNVAVQILTFRADTGELVASDWGVPIQFSYSAQSEIPGLLEVVKDMHVGGRRQAQMPFLSVVGSEGSPAIGLPAEIDVVVVIDLVAVW